MVTNLCHQLVQIDDLERLLLQHLDGTKDHEVLRSLVAEAVASGDLELSDSKDIPIRNPEVVRKTVAASLAPSLQRIAMNALLVA